MADPRPPSGALPSEKEVRQALAKLVVLGVDAVWSPDAQPLLRLPAVQTKVAELGKDRIAEALRLVLLAAIEDLGESQYRLLLTIVLGLDSQYQMLPAGEKREIAGERFRGGARKVGAGTIRQHHEPRALDELASRLMSPSFAVEAPPEGTPSPSPVAEIRWHPELHRQLLKERLVFIRVSFARYHRAEALDALRAAMDASEVRSWSLYELYGLFDVLIRAWVPTAESGHQLTTILMQALGPRIELLEVFPVDGIVMDSTWATATGVDLAASRDLTPADVARLEDGAASEAELAEYEAMGMISRREAAPGGVGFFTMVTLQGHTLVMPQARASFEQAIVAIVQRGQPLLADLEVYAGTGFTNFLIKGTVHSPDLSNLHWLLLEPLAAADAYKTMRINTFIASSPVPIYSVESLSGGKEQSEGPKASHLLLREEGPTFEVKGSAYTNLARWLATGRPPVEAREHRVTESLLRAITAFLNSDGGTILVGAVEKDALDRMKADQSLLRDAPEIGPFLVLGVDHELSEGRDDFARRIYARCKSAIHPEANPYLRIEFDQVADRTVCLIDVRAPETEGLRPWFYCGREKGEMSFFVREGAASVPLVGPAADEYKRAHSTS